MRCVARKDSRVCHREISSHREVPDNVARKACGTLAEGLAGVWHRGHRDEFVERCKEMGVEVNDTTSQDYARKASETHGNINITANDNSVDNAPLEDGNIVIASLAKQSAYS